MHASTRPYTRCEGLGYARLGLPNAEKSQHCFQSHFAMLSPPPPMEGPPHLPFLPETGQVQQILETSESGRLHPNALSCLAVWQETLTWSQQA